MPVQIVRKDTNEVVTMNSGANIWDKAAHAKASIKTSGVSLNHGDPLKLELNKRIGEFNYRNRIKFDCVSDLFEIVEVSLEKPKALKDAIELIKKMERAMFHADTNGTWLDVSADARKFLKENE